MRFCADLHALQWQQVGMYSAPLTARWRRRGRWRSSMLRSLPASDLERWLHRKAEVDIVDVMVALSDADNPEMRSL